MLSRIEERTIDQLGYNGDYSSDILISRDSDVSMVDGRYYSFAERHECRAGYFST